MLKAISGLFLVFLFVGCASSTPSSTTPAATATTPTEANGDIDRFRVNDLKDGDQKIEELEIIPTELNGNVEKWIQYFQGRGREHMEKYLLRSTRYEALMKKVLRDNKLPEDLFYIALIESGFSSEAFSHASAVGYWQFIRGTGKRYKLKINKLVDERRDPVLSTQAAAEYFKDLYSHFNSWYLSMAAYNVGEGRVERSIKKYKTRDFWELARKRRALPAETDNYVPKFIAAKLIAKNPDKYGFEGIDYLPPIEFDHISTDRPVNLRVMAEKMNINYEDFKALNPKYKGEVAPLDDDKSLGLRIPPGTYENAIAAAKDSEADSEEFIADQNEFQDYRVKKGETFSTIARKFRTSVAFLRDINDYPRKKKLRVGRKILVPDRTPLEQTRPELLAKSKKKGKKGTVAASSSDEKKYHIVKKGENLSSIAKKYEVSVAMLKKVNNLKSKARLKLGTKLILPETKKL
ncbi:MAG: transglycosylase SLT domain-containing protein [Pseudobdellovibrio sp.]